MRGEGANKEMKLNGRELGGALLKKKTEKQKVRIIPLGGLEQIGMNITAFEG